MRLPSCSWKQIRFRCKFESAALQQCEGITLIDPYRQNFESSGGIAIAVKNVLGNYHTPEGRKAALEQDPEAEQYLLMVAVDRLSLMAAHPWMLLDMLDPRTPFSGRSLFRIETVISQTGDERKADSASDRLLMKIHLGTEKFADTRPFSIDNEWTHEPFQLHLSVDMRVPIGVVKKKLLAEVERRYKEVEACDFKRIEKRNRADKYAVYLRVLDADRLGVTADEIGKVICPGQHLNDIAALRKQVKQMIEAAKNEQENYWRIAHLD